MVVGDEDVDAARLGDRDLRARARAAVDRDDDRDPAGHRGVDRRERQAVPLVEPARHVRLDRDAEASQRDDQDREPVEAIGIEVAEHHHPLAAVARESEPVEQSIGIGQEPWIVEPIDRLGEPGGELGGAGRPRGVPGGRSCARPDRDPAPRSGAPGRWDDAPGSSSGSAVRAPAQDAMRRSPAPCRRTDPAGRRVIRTRRDVRAGRGPSASRPCAAILPGVPVDQQRGRDEDRGVRAR